MVGQRDRAAVPRAARRRTTTSCSPSAGCGGLPDVKEARRSSCAPARCSASPGLVGSGRSELLRADLRRRPRDAGEVLVDGRPLPPGRPDVAIAAGLGLAPEDRKSQALLLEWNLTKNVTLADVGRFQRGLDPRAGRAGGRRGAAARAAHQAARRRPDGPRAVRRQPAEGGARPLAAAPVPGAAARRADPRRRRRRPRPSCSASSPTSPADGLGVIVVSSELEELCGLCTRILVMREGELVAELDGADGDRARRPAPCDARHPADGRRRGADRRDPTPKGAQRCRRRRSVPPKRSPTGRAAAAARPVRAPGVRPRRRDHRAARRRRDPQARHLPDGRQLPGDPHPGERRRRARHRDDASSSPPPASTCRWDRSSPPPGSPAGCSSTTARSLFVLGALGFGLLLGTVNAVADRLRQGRAVRRHARHAGDRPGPGAADERQAADQPARLRRRALVRHRRDPRACRSRSSSSSAVTVARLGAPQPHPLRTPRRVGRRQPGGGAHRRASRCGGPSSASTASPGLLAGLAAVLLCGRLAQRLAGVGRAARARRDRRHRRSAARASPAAGRPSSAPSWASSSSA